MTDFLRREMPFQIQFHHLVCGFDSAHLPCSPSWRPPTPAQRLNCDTIGTFSKSSLIPMAYHPCSITIACYLCNTFLKTARTGRLCVVLLLRVQNCSWMLIVRRRGASRGRPVKWFA